MVLRDAHHRRAHHFAVAETHPDLAGAFHDMGIGHHMAGSIPHEARPGAPGSRPGTGGGDRHDGRPGLPEQRDIVLLQVGQGAAAG